jgi:hypothetical protein
MEHSVKAQLSLMTLFFLFCTGLPALGQEAGMNAPAYSSTLNAAPATAERQLHKDTDQTSGNIAASLSDHLVVFESRRDTEQKRLVVPFTAFADSPLHLAYDPASRQMMAQWKFDSPRLIGQTLQYQAYLDATGALSFVFSARF